MLKSGVELRYPLPSRLTELPFSREINWQPKRNASFILGFLLRIRNEMREKRRVYATPASHWPYFRQTELVLEEDWFKAAGDVLAKAYWIANWTSRIPLFWPCRDWVQLPFLCKEEALRCLSSLNIKSFLLRGPQKKRKRFSVAQIPRIHSSWLNPLRSCCRNKGWKSSASRQANDGFEPLTAKAGRSKPGAFFSSKPVVPNLRGTRFCRSAG